MDQNVVEQLADLRYQLGQLRSALGARNPEEAELVVGRMRHILEVHDGQIQQGEQDIRDMHAVLRDLVIWARTQGFTGG